MAVGSRSTGAPFDLDAGFETPEAAAAAIRQHTTRECGAWRNAFVPCARFVADGISEIKSGPRKGEKRFFSRKERRHEDGARLVAGIGSIPGDLDLAGARNESDSWELDGDLLVRRKRPLLRSVTAEAIDAYCYIDGRLDADVWRSGNGIQCSTLVCGAEHFASDEELEDAKLIFAGLNIARALALLRRTGCTSDAFLELHHLTRLPGTLNRKRKDGAWQPDRPCAMLREAERSYDLQELNDVIVEELGSEWRDLVRSSCRLGGRKKAANPPTTVEHGRTVASPSASESAKLQSIDFKRRADGAIRVVAGVRVIDLPKPIGTGDTPLDEVNARISLRAAARLAGWTELGGGRWSRPGSSSGGDHAHEVTAADGTQLLKVWTTNHERYPQGEILNAAQLLADAAYQPRTLAETKEARRKFAERRREEGFGQRRTAEVRAGQALTRSASLPVPSRSKPSRSYACPDVDSSRNAVRDELRSWMQQAGRSIQVVGPPGLGKTTLAIEELILALDARVGRCEHGLAFVGEPTIEIAKEKKQKALELKRSLSADVAVELLLGRQPNLRNGFYCEDFAAARRRQEAGRNVCGGCPFAQKCISKPRRFLHDVRRLSLEKMRSTTETPMLVIATHAAMPLALQVASFAPAVFDDIGLGVFGELGVVREIKFTHDALIEERERVRAYLEAAGVAASPSGAPEQWAEGAIASLRVLEENLAGARIHLARASRSEAREIVGAIAHRHGVKVSTARRQYTQARGDIDQFIARFRHSALASIVAPSPVVAELVERVLGVIGKDGKRIVQLAESLTEPLREALRQPGLLPAAHGILSDAGLPFEQPGAEDAVDDVPAIASKLLDLLREAIHKGSIVIERLPRKDLGPRGWVAYVRNDVVLDAIMDGRVAVLSVHPPVSAIAELAVLEHAQIEFRPPNLFVLALQYGARAVPRFDAVICKSLGAGLRQRRAHRDRAKRSQKSEPGGASLADAIVRHLVEVIAIRHGHGLELDGRRWPTGIAALLHKKDVAAIREDGMVKRLREAFGAKHLSLGWFGRHDRATDEFAEHGVIVVRRNAVPPQETAREARALRAVLPIPPIEVAVQPIARMVHWDGVEAAGVVEWGSSDPLEAELAALHIRGDVINAIGRTRAAATSEPRLSILACGIPVQGVVVDAVLDERAVKARLGVEPEPSAAALRRWCVRERVVRARERAEARRKIEDALRNGRVRSVDRLAKELGVERRLVQSGISEWKVGARAGQAGFAPFRASPRPEATRCLEMELLAIFGARPDLAPCHSNFHYQGGTSGRAWPTANEVRDELAKQGGTPPSGRAVRRYLALLRGWLSGEALELPKRVTAESAMLAVARGVAAVLGVAPGEGGESAKEETTTETQAPEPADDTLEQSSTEDGPTEAPASREAPVVDPCMATQPSAIEIEGCEEAARIIQMTQGARSRLRDQKGQPRLFEESECRIWEEH